MITARRFFWAHLLIATIALVIGYGIAGSWQGVLAVIIAVTIWLAAEWRGARGVEGWMLFAFYAAAGLGLWIQTSTIAMLIAGVATVGAWDLDHFLQRIKQVDG